jgi:hypothetical protein
MVHVKSQWFAKILVHTIFSTNERRPFLRDGTACEWLHRYMGGIRAKLHDRSRGNACLKQDGAGNTSGCARETLERAAKRRRLQTR